MNEIQKIDLQYTMWVLDMAQASAAVANFCDHREHVEPANPEHVKRAAEAMGGIALEIADFENIDLQKAYAQRIRAVEERNVLHTPEGLDGAALVLAAETWRDVQLVQAVHNEYYHPDVAGLTPQNQLRHYAFHVAKLTGALADVAKDGVTEKFLETRLPDIAIFRVLIATAMDDALPDAPIR